ncbi:hypothetical protein HanIR_Chr10g0467981 [Helianthus annuus]|nr:hypothetical protein HanIR_Chr10g0467981 [Helianthus annuus]
MLTLKHKVCYLQNLTGHSNLTKYRFSSFARCTTRLHSLVNGIVCRMFRPSFFRRYPFCLDT